MFASKIILLVLTALAVKCTLPPQTPVIGIFTLPDSGDEPTLDEPYPNPNAAGNYSYIAASYVKFVQMSGAQVVPIFAFSNTSYLDSILSKVNGVLFTGGGTYINIGNRWTQNADYIVKYAIQSNKRGNPFPVWGTCLGFELLAYLTSGYDSNVLTPVTGEKGVKNTLKVAAKTYLYDTKQAELLDHLQKGEGIVYFNHIESVSPVYYNKSTNLKSFWNVASTTVSSSGQQFISTLEGKTFPFFAVQFHPEKNLFQWKVNADRSYWGAYITQILSNKFIDVARGSKNKFDSDEELRKNIIYNYKAQFTKMSFTQIYLFEQKTTLEPEEKMLQTE